eukprot:g6278.t1
MTSKYGVARAPDDARLLHSFRCVGGSRDTVTPCAGSRFEWRLPQALPTGAALPRAQAERLVAALLGNAPAGARPGDSPDGRSRSARGVDADDVMIVAGDGAKGDGNAAVVATVDRLRTALHSAVEYGRAACDDRGEREQEQAGEQERREAQQRQAASPSLQQAPVRFGQTEDALKGGEDALKGEGIETAATEESAASSNGMGPWARLCFNWVTPIVRTGYARELGQSDTFVLPKPLQPATVDAEVHNHYRDGTSLRSALYNMQRRAVAVGVLMNLLAATCRVVQPVSLGYIIEYLDTEVAGSAAPRITLSGALAQCFVLLITSLLAGALQAHYFQLGRSHIGQRAVSACCLLLYEKSLRMSASVRAGGGEANGEASGEAGGEADGKDTGQGQGKGKGGGSGGGEGAHELNLLASDAQNLLEGAFWAVRTAEYAPIIVASVALLFYHLGAAAAAGLFVLVLAVVAQRRIAQYQHRCGRRQMGVTDERVRLTQQALHGIKLVKYEAHESFYGRRIAAARAQELKLLRRVRMCVAFNEFLTGATSLLVALAAFGTCAAIEGATSLTPKRIFVSIATFNLLRQPLTFVPLIVESSLLSALLRECPAVAADAASDSGLAVVGSVSYAAQAPWIRQSTVRENIAFAPGSAVGGGGAVADKEAQAHYRHVLSACGLGADLATFPAGDATVIGEKGVNISGGQRQRVSLARCAMARRQIVLLDDPLSALDSRLAERIFQRCVLELMLGRGRGAGAGAVHASAGAARLVLLVTHDVALLPRVDHVI